jgi:hypothetical protein
MPRRIVGGKGSWLIATAKRARAKRAATAEAISLVPSTTANLRAVGA